MKLSLGFSPCPNDTFIFDALVNGKIDTGGLQFEPVLEDVETLNLWAAEGKLDITKISFPALFQNKETYSILNSGSALGNGVGPLLISKEIVLPEEVKHKIIAIPGKNTTANFLLSFAFPEANKRTVSLFSHIEEQVLNEKTELGLIIHENRFTYQHKGLKKVLDLGAYWEEKTGLPIPLGCIGIKRNLNPEITRQVNMLISKSLEFAFENYPLIPDYVIQHAQAMEQEVMRQHIDLYVNNYSLSLGEKGREAIDTLYRSYLNTTNANSVMHKKYNLFADF